MYLLLIVKDVLKPVVMGCPYEFIRYKVKNLNLDLSKFFHCIGLLHRLVESEQRLWSDFLKLGGNEKAHDSNAFDL
jgi:uncharacterized protein YqhQ